MADLSLPPELEKRFRHLGIREEELRERFVLGGGPGGQKINKTASRVILQHLPSGIEVHCQQERSQARNRLLAREWLCQRIELRARRAKLARDRRRALQRVKAKGRSRATKERLLKDKRRRTEKKRLRGPVRDGDE